MAYEKIGFNKGDVLKAEHLNHIEEGLASVGLVKDRIGINFSDSEFAETLEEIIANPDNYFIYAMDGDFEGDLFFNPWLSDSNYLVYILRH